MELTLPGQKSASGRRFRRFLSTKIGKIVRGTWKLFRAPLRAARCAKRTSEQPCWTRQGGRGTWTPGLEPRCFCRPHACSCVSTPQSCWSRSRTSPSSPRWWPTCSSSIEAPRGEPLPDMRQIATSHFWVYFSNIDLRPSTFDLRPSTFDKSGLEWTLTQKWTRVDLVINCLDKG